MKKHSLKIWIGMMVVFGLFMFGTALTSRAQAVPTRAQNCDLNPKSLYANPENSAWDNMAFYHEFINDSFNAYTRRMINANPNNPNGIAPDIVISNYKTVEKYKKAMDAACYSGANFSTYCVAHTLLTHPTYGYMEYKKALQCQRGELSKELGDLMSGKAISENVITPFEAYPVALYQNFASIYKSVEVNAIDRSISTSKRALDQTLSAHDQLRTAWAMHEKYMEIYEELIKYRDKIVEIRHQVEEFPSKFIDATTTSCT